MPAFLFFTIIFLLYTAINTYIFHKTWRVLPGGKPVKIVFLLVYLFFYSAFIITMLSRNVLRLEVQKILYFPGTCWLGFMLYLFLFFLFTDTIFGLGRLLRIFTKSKKRSVIQITTGYITVACLMIYGYYHFMHPETVRQEIIIRKSAGNYRELKIVGLSDLHLGANIDKNRLKQFIQQINSQNPDMVFIAGDIVDNNIFPLMQEKMWEEFAQISAPLGVYACLGNHEYISGVEPCMDFFRKTDIQLLVDSAALINNSFWLIGRDDLQGNPERKSLSDLVTETDTIRPLFLLDHEPVNLNDAAQNGIDLQFSGHTHRGQLWPFSLLIERMYEVSYGYFRNGNTQYYITSGIGLWGPPFRIGTDSEIIVFNIRFLPVQG